MKKKSFLFFTTIFSFIFIYIFFYIYTFVNLEKNILQRFHSLESLNFHEKYSNKIHHLRSFKEIKKLKYSEYLYTVIEDFKSEKTNILFQGDAWAEQLINPEGKEENLKGYIKKILKKNNLGFINSGIASFSPTLMKLQLQVLENDFKIFPDIIMAHIDQTDIGDENCRYKNKIKIKNNEIKSVSEKKYTGKQYDNTKLYKESKILLKKQSKLIKTFKIINFNAKYELIKFKNKNTKKISRILKYGYKNRKEIKCYSKIHEYLVKSSSDEIAYFEKTVSDYINFVKKNDNVKKLFLVTFPHKNHIPKLYESENLYKHNVSNIVDNLIKNDKKIFHLNFTKLIAEKKINNEKNNFFKNDPLAHINYDYYRNTYIKKLIDFVLNNLEN